MLRGPGEERSRCRNPSGGEGRREDGQRRREPRGSVCTRVLPAQPAPRRRAGADAAAPAVQKRHRPHVSLFAPQRGAEGAFPLGLHPRGPSVLLCFVLRTAGAGAPDVSVRMGLGFGRNHQYDSNTILGLRWT